MKQFLKDTLYLLAFLTLVLVALCAVEYIACKIPLYLSIPIFCVVVAVMFRDCF